MLEVFGKISRAFNIRGRDAKIFLVSLLLAFAIWLIHNLSLYYSELVRIPVIAQCDIPGHAQLSSNSSIVIARCRAAGFNHIRLRRAEKRNPVKIQFRFEDLHRKGEEVYYATASDLESYSAQIFGSGSKLEVYVTDTLTFRFPAVSHKIVPVQPGYSLDFKPQYVNVSPLKMMPDSVTVYGEPSHLGTIDRVFTEPMTLGNVSSSLHGVVRLEKIKGVRISDESVSYAMDVSRYVEIRKQIPVYGRNVPKGRSLIIYPSSAEVTFRCAFPVSSDPSDVARVYVDYEDFAQSLEGQCIAQVENLPSGVIGYSVQPSVFDCVESGQ